MSELSRKKIIDSINELRIKIKLYKKNINFLESKNQYINSLNYILNKITNAKTEEKRSLLENIEENKREKKEILKGINENSINKTTIIKNIKNKIESINLNLKNQNFLESFELNTNSNFYFDAPEFEIINIEKVKEEIFNKSNFIELNKREINYYHQKIFTDILDIKYKKILVIEPEELYDSIINFAKFYFGKKGLKKIIFLSKDENFSKDTSYKETDQEIKDYLNRKISDEKKLNYVCYFEINNINTYIVFGKKNSLNRDKDLNKIKKFFKKGNYISMTNTQKNNKKNNKLVYLLYKINKINKTENQNILDSKDILINLYKNILS